MMTTIQSFEGPSCPLPLQHNETIVMGHGSGGKMTQDLIKNVFYPYFNSAPLSEGNDFARAALPESANLKGRLSISTDCHSVAPIQFPGGDIGKLAVCGTVNDMCMSGALPLYLTAGFILEEGLPIATLQQIVASMAAAAQEAGVAIVAGDTKVVEHGKADGVYITTAGIGWIPESRTIGGQYAQPGDVVIISGFVGDHGMAVLTARGDLGFEADIQSDVAPLNLMIANLLQAAPNTHVLRDPTRGGLATTLNEIVQQSGVGMMLNETEIPVRPVVRTACEMLGFDPLYVANEGKLIAILPAAEAQAGLQAIKDSPYGDQAAIIGEVVAQPHKRVLLRTEMGTTRILDTLAGEMLPRIC
ncbi:MAG: hydrogenase expression/formation protein HypE [Chloroflexi bacterium]|nr:hydrogenase expression/formation protein HypE [Chloroflexota bacterium]